MMITTKIPTTCFVCKIVFAQRGLTYTNKPQKHPFSLKDKDELFDLLKHNGRIRKQTAAHATLSHFLTFAISERIHAKMGRDCYAIGEHLDRFYKREMCKEVWVKVQSGSERVSAIREFLERYDIEENDYAEEAAIKCVQRFFLRKKTAKLEAKTIPTVGDLLPISPKLFTDKEMEVMFLTYKNFYPFYFVTAKKKERKELPDQCRAWIYKNIGNYTDTEIANRFRVSRGTAWKRAKAFEQEFRGRPMPVPYFSAATSSQ